MLLLLTSVLLTSGYVYGTNLCGEKEWYDDLKGVCRKCKPCVGKLMELGPCSDFMDTLCVDLTELGRSVARSIKAGEDAIQKVKVDAANHQTKHHRWHETEGRSVEEARLDVRKETSVSKNLLDGSFDQWDMLFVTIISLLFLFFVILIILGTVKYYKSPLICGDRGKVARSRLFSRDRLNTTEYMNNLATLDRRLAIDEILEKKKRAAIFEPQLLNENIYTDEVFVDISGLPRNLRHSSHHDYEEIDNKKCLLEMQEQQ